MYYGLIILSVVMFGANFALNDVYRQTRGSSIRASLEFNLFGGLAGIIVLFAFNGIVLEFTPLTLLMSLLSAINSFAFTFCGFKALGSINLSLYSLFSMLGGMLLPFVQGITFYGEEITVAKALCFAFILAALLLTVEKSDKRGGLIYYVGIFVLNGMSGVINKLYNTAPFEKASAAGYSIMSAMWCVLISSLLLIFLFRKGKETPSLSYKSAGIATVGGSISRVANFILVLSLEHVENSVQYPMVTGGVIIVSTLICFFGKNKPKNKELISVALSFVGLLILFLIPMIIN